MDTCLAVAWSTKSSNSLATYNWAHLKGSGGGLDGRDGAYSGLEDQLRTFRFQALHHHYYVSYVI